MPRSLAACVWACFAAGAAGFSGILRRRPSAVGSSRGRRRVAVAAADETFDVVVIGSGIGGLSCAGLLAAAGKSVCVVESHYEFGGCAHEYAVGLDGSTIPSAPMPPVSASVSPRTD